MSIAVSVRPVRVEGEGKVSFAGWELDKYEKLASGTFEQGIENGLRHSPPSLHVDATERDVLLTFGIGEALGDGDGIGPAFEFSLKETLESVTDCHPDDVKILISAMRNLADYAEGLIEGTPS